MHSEVAKSDSPSGIPAALMASVTRMARSGPLAFHQRRTISGVWTPSQTNGVKLVAVRTVPRIPGSRWSSARMALKVGGASAPAAMAAKVSAAVALEWPNGDADAAFGDVLG